LKNPHEIDAFLLNLGRDRRGEHHGIAVLRQDGAVSLARHATGFEHQTMAAQFHFHTMYHSINPSFQYAITVMDPSED
jgi:hypothetical protein